MYVCVHPSHGLDNLNVHGHSYGSGFELKAINFNQAAHRSDSDARHPLRLHGLILYGFWARRPYTV